MEPDRFIAERIVGDLSMELNSAELMLNQAKDEHKRGLIADWQLQDAFSTRDAFHKAVNIAKDNLEEGT